MSIRQDKVASLLKKDIGAYFQQNGSVYCPGGMITVTVIRVVPDLSFARVYLSVFGVDDKQKVVDAVKEDAWKIRKEMGRLNKNVLRIVPEFNFYLDDSLDYAEEIDSILKK